MKSVSLPNLDHPANPSKYLSILNTELPPETMLPRPHHLSLPPRLRFTLVYAALFLPFAVATPYLQVLLRLRGFDRQSIGLILGSLEIMAVVAPPVWGRLSDRTQRPRLFLVLAVLVALPSFLLFGFVTRVAAAVAVAVLFGFCYRPLIPLTDGLVFRHLRTHGGDYGVVRIGGSVSFVLLSIVLVRLGIAGSETGRMILVAMSAAFLCQLVGIGLLPRQVRAEPDVAHLSARGALRVFLSRPFLLFTLAAFLGRFAMMSYYGFFSLYLREVHGFENAGLIWLIGSFSEIPVIYYSRRIMARIGVRNLFALGLLGCVVRLFGYSIAPGLWLIIPLQFLHSLTFGAYHSASVTYVSRIVPPHLQSTAQTLFAAVTVGGGGILGGLLGGCLAQHAGFPAMYAAAGLVALLGLMVLFTGVPGEGLSSVE